MNKCDSYIYLVSLGIIVTVPFFYIFLKIICGGRDLGSTALEFKMIKDWHLWLAENNNSHEEQILRRCTSRDLPAAPQDVLDSLSIKLKRIVKIRSVGRPRNI
jgi:hypothetical protein